MTFKIQRLIRTRYHVALTFDEPLGSSPASLMTKAFDWKSLVPDSGSQFERGGFALPLLFSIKPDEIAASYSNDFQ